MLFFLLVLILFAFMIIMQGISFELDDEMVAEDDDREALQDIINNSKLSEGYLTLARDIEVMEAKTPEDIYKVWTFDYLLFFDMDLRYMLIFTDVKSFILLFVYILWS